MIKLILKRDGSLVPFEPDKIAIAIDKSFQASDNIKTYDKQIPERLANEVVKIIEEMDVGVPTVEFVQDIVEEVLIEKNYIKAAKAYILYREKRSNQRKMAVTLGGSFEQLQSYQPKNSFYNSPKARARILGETSLASYNQSSHFDCFVSKALEQKILTINNMAYLDDLIYQYVIDCQKIEQSDSDVGLNKFLQVVIFFDKFQQGPLQLCNFDSFMVSLVDDPKVAKKMGLVLDSLEMFLENRLEIERGGLDDHACRMLGRNNIAFVDDVSNANVVYNIGIDVELLELNSFDLGIDLDGLENRLKDFLNKATRQLFDDSVRMLGDYRQYLAYNITVNQLDLINAKGKELQHSPYFLEGLDDKIDIESK